MKSIRLLVFIVAAAVFVSCGGGSRTAIVEGPVTIDVAAKYPAEEIVLQDIADVEYVPLAISKEVLLTPNDRIFHLSDEHIMIANRSSGGIFVFNRDGSIASQFNRKGRGPGEYGTISGIVFDAEAGEIFVMDMVPPAKIIVYTTSGELRRTLSPPVDWLIEVWNFDAERLLVYYNERRTVNATGTKYYHLMSKTDGAITDTIAIDIPKRYSNQTVMTADGAGPQGQTLYQAMMLQTINHRLGGGDGAVVLADISSDTIYNFTRNRVLTPTFVRTPSVHAVEPRVVWTTSLNTAGFTLFDVATLDFERAKAGNGYDRRALMRDNATGEITEPTFTDENNPAAEWKAPVADIETPDTAVSMLNALTLVEAHEKGELKGPLAELAAKIKEDDNPVVMIVKFR